MRWQFCKKTIAPHAAENGLLILIVLQRPGRSFITARCHFNNARRWHVIAFREAVDVGNWECQGSKSFGDTNRKL